MREKFIAIEPTGLVAFVMTGCADISCGQTLRFRTDERCLPRYGATCRLAWSDLSLSSSSIEIHSVALVMNGERRCGEHRQSAYFNFSSITMTSTPSSSRALLPRTWLLPLLPPFRLSTQLNGPETSWRRRQAHPPSCTSASTCRHETFHDQQ